MTEELKSAQGEFFKGGTPIEYAKANNESKAEETPSDEVIETLEDLGSGKAEDKKYEEIENLEDDLEVVKKETPKADKNWRDSYKETDEFKNEIKKQDLASYDAKMTS